MTKYIIKETHDTDSLENKITCGFNQSFKYLEVMVGKGDMDDMDMVSDIIDSLKDLMNDLGGDIEKRAEELADEKALAQYEHDKLVEQGLA